MLDDAVARGVVVVSALAGSGKTHLVAGWALAKSLHSDLAWLSLEAADGDPVHFVLSARAAVRSSVSGTMEGLPPPPPQTGVDDQYLGVVGGWLSNLDRDLFVVLDDFQEVAGTAAERLVARILRFRPPRLHVVVVSRAEPDIGQARLRLAGEVTEIGAGELAFTLDETRDLMRICRVTIDEEELRGLVDGTEGWVAALRLATMSLAGAGDPPVAVRQFVAGDEMVDEYVLTEVLGRQPPEVQEFLLRTCIVERVTGGLADALTDRRDGGRMLAELHRANLFLVALDRGGAWYRWHGMFRTLLRRQLHAREKELVPLLHRHAAEWFHRHGLEAPTIRHAVEGGDPDLAARVLGDCWLDLALSGDLATLRGLLDCFDERAWTDHAELAVASAFVALGDDDLDMATRLARRALRLATELPPDRRLNVEMLVAVERLRVSTMVGRDLDGARDSALDLLDQMRDPSRVPSRRDRVRWCLLLYTLGAFETVALLWEPAATHLRESLAMSRSLGLLDLELSSLSQFVSHDFHNGRLERARGSALAVLGSAEQRGWTGYHNLATAFDNLGGICILRNEIGAAMQYLDQAAQLVRPVDRVSRFNVSYLTAVALRAAGRVDEARVELRRLRTVRSGWDAPDWVDGSLATSEADQLACEGDVTGAIQRMETAPVSGIGASVTRPFAAVHAALLVRAGRAEAANELLAHRPQTGPRPFRTAELIAGAIALSAVGRRDHALGRLDLALDAAAEERITHPFVAGGTAVADLLRELVDAGTARELFAVELLALVAPVRGGTGTRVPGYVEPLSRRELQVLRLLQATLTNHQIAARLFVSPNTLKSHVKRINQKLGTVDRREAVQAARRLGIL